MGTGWYLDCCMVGIVEGLGLGFGVQGLAFGLFCRLGRL